ncbi:MAG: alpha-galactosidase, partial [Maribacter dokdonensis]
PQLSMFISKASFEHKKMIAFYTDYWNKNADLLMNGDFTPYRPLANYPLQKVTNAEKAIFGVYDAYVLDLEDINNEFHILNGQITDSVIIRNANDFEDYQCSVYDCQGLLIGEKTISLNKGILEVAIPPCGILIGRKA